MSNTNCTPSTAATIKSGEIVQQQLDAALKKSGMDPAAITNLLTTVSSSIVCDDECQKRKQIDALKLKYDAAKQNVKPLRRIIMNTQKETKNIEKCF